MGRCSSVCPGCGSRRLFLQVSEEEIKGYCLDCHAKLVRTADGSFIHPPPRWVRRILRLAS
jgi:hypothetical protein